MKASISRLVSIPLIFHSSLRHATATRRGEALAVPALIHPLRQIEVEQCLELLLQPRRIIQQHGTSNDKPTPTLSAQAKASKPGCPEEASL
ncbi:hypothetical protein BJX62DRAFT_182915 [Aspergillus germanicus]